MKWFFGIITDGTDNRLLQQVITAIHAQPCEKDVWVCGNVGEMPTVKTIPQPHLARDGRLGAMRNKLVYQRGDADMVVILDDDVILQDGFIQGFDKFGYEGWDVASCQIHNPDGSRYWDWKIHRHGMNWLIPYDQTSRDISLTGGLIVAKAEVFDTVCWNPSLGFYEYEDVDFTDLLKRHGFNIVFNPHSVAVHMGPYTQHENGVYRTKL